MSLVWFFSLSFILVFPVFGGDFCLEKVIELAKSKGLGVYLKELDRLDSKNKGEGDLAVASLVDEKKAEVIHGIKISLDDPTLTSEQVLQVAKAFRNPEELKAQELKTADKKAEEAKLDSQKIDLLPLSGVALERYIQEGHHPEAMQSRKDRTFEIVEVASFENTPPDPITDVGRTSSISWGPYGFFVSGFFTKQRIANATVPTNTHLGLYKILSDGRVAFRNLSSKGWIHSAPLWLGDKLIVREGTHHLHLYQIGKTGKILHENEIDIPKTPEDKNYHFHQTVSPEGVLAVPMEKRVYFYKLTPEGGFQSFGEYESKGNKYIAQSVSWTPDGKGVFVTADGLLEVIESDAHGKWKQVREERIPSLKNGSELFYHPPIVSPDGVVLLIDEQQDIRLFRSASPLIKVTYDPSLQKRTGIFVEALRLSRPYWLNSETLVAGDYIFGKLAVLNLQGEEMFSKGFPYEEERVTRTIPGPDGLLAVQTAKSVMIYHMDPHTQEPRKIKTVVNGADDHLKVSWGKDGQLAVLYRNGNWKVFQVK